MDRRWLALAGVTLGVLAVGLDVTVLAVALPTLASALRASESDLQWFASGYALTLSAGMLPAGILGDRFGRKRVMLASLVLFAAGSLACAMSTTPAQLVAARLVLGASGAGITVMALSIVTVLFDEVERPRAIGAWAAANFLALPVGPILGGWLLSNFWWGWVFLLNLPVAALGVAAVIAVVPESRSPERPAVDPAGILLGSGGLALLTYGLIELGRNGWTDGPSLAQFAGGVAILAGFVAWERRAGPAALLDLELFRSRRFTWGLVLTSLGALCLFGAIFALPQYWQGVEGVNAQGAGFRLLPAIAGLVVGGAGADRVAARVGPKLVVATGYAIIVVALLAGTQTGPASSDAFVAAWVAAMGLGMGLAFATAASTAMATVPTERSGVASAIAQALQKVGAPLGSAILGSVIMNGYRAGLVLDGVPPPAAGAVRQSLFAGLAVAEKLHSPVLLASVRAAFSRGFDQSLGVSAAIAAVAMLLALVFLPGRVESAQAHPAESAGKAA